jgi:hypothetical protein
MCPYTHPALVHDQLEVLWLLPKSHLQETVLAPIGNVTKKIPNLWLTKKKHVYSLSVKHIVQIPYHLGTCTWAAGSRKFTAWSQESQNKMQHTMLTTCLLHFMKNPGITEG